MIRISLRSISIHIMFCVHCNIYPYYVGRLDTFYIMLCILRRVISCNFELVTFIQARHIYLVNIVIGYDTLIRKYD